MMRFKRANLDHPSQSSAATRRILATPPRLLRSTIARGLSQSAGDKSIDERGGDFGAGLIRGMAILTVGEALGHGLWCDRVMLAQAGDAINASETGTKARFTHPDMSGDGLGKVLGRVKNAQLEGDVLRGDLHFNQSAHQTPDGDLAAYVMLLAMEDPTAFGNSIAFDEDFQAEEIFQLEHTSSDGDRAGEFQSPDSDNVRHLPHARIASLRAVDAVDDPAANPNGLFHRGDEIARDAEQLLAWSLGLSADKPQLVSLDVDPDRISGFIERFFHRHNLSLSQKDRTMPLPTLGKFAAGLTKQLAEKESNESRDEKKEKTGEEEGDADKDEDNDKGKKEGQGDFDAGGADSDAGEEDEKEKKEMAAAKARQLAKGGELPSGTGAGDEATIEDEKQKTAEEVAKKSKERAERDTPVGTPGSDKSAIGPLGDASNNVGYSQARADAKKFVESFGAKGAVWFADGKSFAEASALHAQELAKENAALKSENEQLKAKSQASRGLSKPLNPGGESSSFSPEQLRLNQNMGGGGIARFAIGLEERFQKMKTRN